MYVVAQVPPTADKGYAFYGGAEDFFYYKGRESILEGPFETGKTLVCLTKLHALLCKYPNARALITRDTYASLITSAIPTYENKVLPVPPTDAQSGVSKYGGNKPEFYDYPNGSRIVVAGLDNPGRTLSAEYDYIYVNQAEELSLDTWETLTRATTGRAGNVPEPMIFADCNPGPPTHWILHRKALKRFRQMHEHNPSLFDQRTGEITPQGKRTMETLNALTGVRYKRGRLGLWVAAEGQVYEEFDPGVHVIEPFPIPDSWPRYCAIDFGYQNPFVCQWWATDEDKRMYLYREIYKTKRTVKVHSQQIKQYSDAVRAYVTDHDAEDRATLTENGIVTVAAKKDISVGIEKVAERLKIQPDGRARLFVFNNALIEADPELYEDTPGDKGPVCTEMEFTSYVYPKGVDGKLNKEVPVDLYNHGMDAVRYMAMYLDKHIVTKQSKNPFYGHG
jgi:PBSX family phage terminase large subunit